MAVLALADQRLFKSYDIRPSEPLGLWVDQDIGRFGPKFNAGLARRGREAAMDSRFLFGHHG